jgi:hypothetical protein
VQGNTQSNKAATGGWGWNVQLMNLKQPVWRWFMEMRVKL